MGLYPSSIKRPSEYHPKPGDVRLVRTYLTFFVPLELANIILDDAMYWPKVDRAREVVNPNQPLVVTQGTGPVCFLLTPKLSTLIGPGLREGEFWKVRRVRFRIVSHDQGWCSQGGFTEPYAGSWTWFEAAIGREEAATDLDKDSQTNIQHCIRMFVDKREDHVQIGKQICTVNRIRTEKEHSDVWHIQRNVRASRDDTQHEVVWTGSEENPDEMDGDEMRFTDATGAGRGYGFVDKLEANDRIAIIARALFPEWVNYVNGVEVDIFYSI